METIQIGSHQITYDRHGDPANPTVVLLTGWCQDHRLFDPLLPELTDFDVIRIDWRGHGEDRRAVRDFGPEQQAADTLEVLAQLGVERFLPLSTSHGGWANLEIVERMGSEAVPATIVIDWIMTPAWTEFIESLEASQNPDTWEESRDGLFEIWIAGTGHPAVEQHLREMAEFKYQIWATGCRVIRDAYDAWGSPLQRMRALSDKPEITHLFSQPTAPEYLATQEAFGARNPWFTARNLGGPTHFPTLDSPARVAEEIRRANRL